MKKFIITSLLFAIFAAIFYTCTLFLWGNYAYTILKPNVQYKLGDYGHSFTRFKEVKNVRDVDILFLGSSHAFRGFDTRIFTKHGFNTFNLGSPSQTPMQTLTLVRRYLDQIQPKSVIYEVYPSTLTIDGVEASLDIVSNDKNDVHSLNMALKTKHIMTYNTLLYAATRDRLHLNESFSEPTFKENKARGGDTYIEGGYVEKELRYFKPKQNFLGYIVPDKYQLATFGEVIDEIRKRDIELMLVFAPLTKHRYCTYLNNDDYDSLMTSYAHYYNFNEMMDLNDSLHFYDYQHLNQSGVELFNLKLIDVIKKNKNKWYE